MFSNQAKVCNEKMAAEVCVDLGKQGAVIGSASNVGATDSIRPMTASQEVINELDYVISWLMGVSDRAEGLADRLMGGYLARDADGEKKSYCPGLLGEIAQKIDTMKIVAGSLELHVDRLQRLG